MTERTPPPAHPMPELNEMRRTDADGPEKGGLPAGLERHYLQQGLTWRPMARPQTVAVVDRGHRMHTFSPNSASVVSAMTIAAQSRGWTSMEVSGSDAFRRTAYVEATARGIDVAGFEPNNADRAAASRGADLVSSLRNPKIQAYLTASSSAERTTACASYPGLDKAFAAEDAARRMIGGQTGSNPGVTSTFIARFRENTAIALHKGREIPEIETTTRSSEVRR